MLWEIWILFAKVWTIRLLVDSYRKVIQNMYVLYIYHGCFFPI